jgi:hypothetical protein
MLIYRYLKNLVDADVANIGSVNCLVKLISQLHIYEYVDLMY